MDEIIIVGCSSCPSANNGQPCALVDMCRNFSEFQAASIAGIYSDIASDMDKRLETVREKAA